MFKCPTPICSTLSLSPLLALLTTVTTAQLPTVAVKRKAKPGPGSFPIRPVCEMLFRRGFNPTKADVFDSSTAAPVSLQPHYQLDSCGVFLKTSMRGAICHLSSLNFVLSLLFLEIRPYRRSIHRRGNSLSFTIICRWGLS